MSVLLMWLCFLVVLAGILLALGVILRDVRRQVVARRSATDLDTAVATAAVPQRELVSASAAAGLPMPLAPALGVPAFTGAAPSRLDGRIPAARRGLGAPAQGAPAPRRPVQGRGLGSTTPDLPRATRATHRGLGRRPHS